MVRNNISSLGSLNSSNLGDIHTNKIVKSLKYQGKGCLMKTGRVYIGGLVNLLLVWGIFGFTSALPHSEIVLQETPVPVESTPADSGDTVRGGIPVTAEPEPVWIEILVFYGLIGITALFLILALLSLANKSTAPHGEHKNSTSDKFHSR